MTDQPLLEHHYQGETPLRTLWLLFESDRTHLFIAIVVFLFKHSPVWLLPLLTANIIDVVVQHRPIAELWWNALILVLLLFQNIPLHVLYMRQLSTALRRMETRLRSAFSRQLQRACPLTITRAPAPGCCKPKLSVTLKTSNRWCASSPMAAWVPPAT